MKSIMDNLFEKCVYRIDYLKNGQWYPYDSIDYECIKDTNYIVNPDHLMKTIQIKNRNINVALNAERVHFGYKWLPKCLKWINETMEASTVWTLLDPVVPNFCEDYTTQYTNSLESSWQEYKYLIEQQIEKLLSTTDKEIINDITE